MARGKPRHLGVPGPTLCPIDLPAARSAKHNVVPGSPGRRAPSWLSRRRGRPPASEQRGRSPSIHHPRDQAARETLGCWNATAFQRPRRPVTRKPRPVAVSESDTETVAVSVAVSVSLSILGNSRERSEAIFHEGFRARAGHPQRWDLNRILRSPPRSPPSRRGSPVGA